MGSASNILLKSSKLTIGYKHRQETNTILLSELDLQITSGQMITLIGPNGSGKSTLIKSLIGFIPGLNGDVYLKNEKLGQINASTLALNMGVVLTDPVYELNLSVFELVSMGRYQHTNWIGRLKNEDKDRIIKAIQDVGLNHKISARLGELSDGEKQRALIARVLSQDVDLIILDEPTAHLDLPNRMEILMLLKELSHQHGKGILLSTHELGLALQVSDKIWLINNNKELKQEIPERLIFEGELDKTFGNEHIAFQPESASFEINATSGLKASVEGMGNLFQCVRRMLKRFGFDLVEPDLHNTTVRISVNADNEELFVKHKGIKHIIMNLEQLNLLLVEIIHKEYLNGI